MYFNKYISRYNILMTQNWRLDLFVIRGINKLCMYVIGEKIYILSYLNQRAPQSTLVQSVKMQASPQHLDVLVF